MRTQVRETILGKICSYGRAEGAKTAHEIIDELNEATPSSSLTSSTSFIASLASIRNRR
jgi:hypothetical protein